MKQIYICILTCILGLYSSCVDLDLAPLSEGSSENWYSYETELDMCIKDLYKDAFWIADANDWTDDWIYRETLNPITSATINGEWGNVTTLWANMYKAIARANTILLNLPKAEANGVSKQKIDQFTGEVYFSRAHSYADLVTHFGDVVFLRDLIDIEEAFKMGRTDKREVIKAVYEDYDKAIDLLPIKHTTSATSRATKGAALALKARFALYNADWSIAAEAAKACLELNNYQLHPDYGNLFLPATKNSKESIFVLPRSIPQNSYLGSEYVLNTITRCVGGWAAMDPSWDLLAAYTCTDGLPIDESPLFDPHNPFKNRDPRCTETIVEFGIEHLGVIYDPHPEVLEVMNFTTGKKQKNNDNRVNAQFASFNGLVWKKGVDKSWLENGFKVDPDKIIIRLADVMLIYAEAMIEQNQINSLVVEMINKVRARAYKVDYTDVSSYPAIQIGSQDELRRIVRLERRMEFANEGLRYMDLIRWKLAEKALNRKNYGMLDPNALIEKVVKPGLWFFPQTPNMDEDGIADFSEMEKKGLIKVLSQRVFDVDKQYLWPIPSKEILINSNLTQNEGY